MTRLLQVVLNAEGTVGGEQRHVLHILDALDRSKYEPTVVTWDVPAFVEELRSRDIDTVVVTGERILDTALLKKLTALVRAGSYDIVHAHGHRAGLMGRLAAVRSGNSRIVWTCHLAENKADKNPLVRFGYRRALRYLHGKTAATLAVSSLLRDWLAAQGIDPSEVTVVPNGVNCEVFKPLPREPALAAELGAEEGVPLVVCVARLTPQKDVETLVRAAAQLLNRGVGVRVGVVGAGPLEDDLRSLAEELSAPVRFVGERSDIPRVLAQADAVVVPSLWEGAFCFSVLEALACARPLVCSDIPIFADVVTADAAARLYAAGDASALAGAIEDVLSDAEKAAAMGERGRRLVMEQYSVESMRRSVLGIYEGLLRGERH